jgi:hypothetical protein
MRFKFEMSLLRKSGDLKGYAFCRTLQCSSALELFDALMRTRSSLQMAHILQIGKGDLVSDWFRFPKGADPDQIERIAAALWNSVESRYGYSRLWDLDHPENLRKGEQARARMTLARESRKNS